MGMNYMSYGGRTEYLPSYPGMPPAGGQGGQRGYENSHGQRGYEASSEQPRTRGRWRERLEAERKAKEEAKEEKDFFARLLNALYGGQEDSQPSPPWDVDPGSPLGLSELNNAFGGRSERSPQWTAYRRGVYPTVGISPGFGGPAATHGARESVSQPTYYNYTGAGPDPGRMMKYPGNPEMWDETGMPNYGSTAGFGAAKGMNERMKRFLSGMGSHRPRFGGR